MESSRRQFLQGAAAASLGALGLPLFVPASALGRQAKAAASERINLGVIGTGGRGRGLMKMFMNEKDVQVVAVCDVETPHRHQAQELVNQKYGNNDCGSYKDFRELIGRKGLDAVVVATPDHWHALASIAAAKANLDIYCEKPLANSVAEGRAICDAVKQHKRILQTGSHERSGSNARFACELVRSGKIGKLHTIRINLPCADKHHLEARALTKLPEEQKVPDGFDYDLWLGPTANVPYYEKRCHFWWRFNLAYGGGEMTDRGAHVIDLAQLGAGFDSTGPVEIWADGFRNKDSLYNVFWDYAFVNSYANGVRMIGSSGGPRGVKFIGSDGWIFIHVHGAKLDAEPASLLNQLPPSKPGPIDIHLRNFLDCVKSRKEPHAPAEVGHRTGSICHLNNIAMLLGRKLKWDPTKEQFIGDAEANRLLAPKMREPWKL
jgi:predicted dehydrogenase